MGHNAFIELSGLTCDARHPLGHPLAVMPRAFSLHTIKSCFDLNNKTAQHVHTVSSMFILSVGTTQALASGRNRASHKSLEHAEIMCFFWQRVKRNASDRLFRADIA